MMGKFDTFRTLFSLSSSQHVNNKRSNFFTNKLESNEVANLKQNTSDNDVYLCVCMLEDRLCTVYIE